VVLFGEGESGGDAGVAGEEGSEEGGAVALLAAVEEDDVVGEAGVGGLGAVEDVLDGGEGLAVGEVAFAAGDAAFQEPGAVAVHLQVGVVVAFEGEAIEVVEVFEEARGDVAEVGGVADAVVEAGDDEAVGAVLVVG
jgi:hypothetical protein